MRGSAARTFAGHPPRRDDGGATGAVDGQGIARPSREYCGGTSSSPNAGYFQVRDTVKSRLDCGVILVRRHFVSTGGVWKRIQSGCPIGLLFGYFGTRQAGFASGADLLPTADARTPQLIASW